MSDDESDDVGRPANDVASEHRLIGLDQAEAVAAAHIGSGQHADHAGEGEREFRVDATQASARDRRAHGRRVKAAVGRRQVLRIRGRAGGLRRAVETIEATSDRAGA